MWVHLDSFTNICLIFPNQVPLLHHLHFSSTCFLSSDARIKALGFSLCMCNQKWGFVLLTCYWTITTMTHLILLNKYLTHCSFHLFTGFIGKPQHHSMANIEMAPTGTSQPIRKCWDDTITCYLFHNRNPKYYYWHQSLDKWLIHVSNSSNLMPTALRMWFWWIEEFHKQFFASYSGSCKCVIEWGNFQPSMMPNHTGWSESLKDC